LQAGTPAAAPPGKREWSAGESVRVLPNKKPILPPLGRAVRLFAGCAFGHAASSLFLSPHILCPDCRLFRKIQNPRSASGLHYCIIRGPGARRAKAFGREISHVPATERL